MGFEGLDSSLCNILLVVICVTDLVFQFLFLDAFDHFFGHFVVKSLYDRVNSSFLEFFVACIVAFNEVSSALGFDRFSKNGIGIVIIQDEDVVVISGGRYRKTTW